VSSRASEVLSRTPFPRFRAAPGCSETVCAHYQQEYAPTCPRQSAVKQSPLLSIFEAIRPARDYQVLLDQDRVPAGIPFICDGRASDPSPPRRMIREALIADQDGMYVAVH
jgi:hypothetical protein